MGSKVVAYDQLPITLRPPLTNVGVRFAEQPNGGVLAGARLDVVDRTMLPPSPSGTRPPDPTLAAAADDRMVAGTEPGVVARARSGSLVSGDLIVSLAHLDLAPHPAGYEVYLVMRYDSTCGGQAASASGAASRAVHGTVDLATVLP